LLIYHINSVGVNNFLNSFFACRPVRNGDLNNISCFNLPRQHFLISFLKPVLEGFGDTVKATEFHLTIMIIGLQ
ncbi:hypothetical protein, partial [Guptibacillus hwajinpoensis]|uniref:hypothetical protein n=1 Tax=Guptibacillus hwajinpoensis TaxID=208199 RepID=UPI001F29C066